jgi:HEAT repeats
MEKQLQLNYRKTRFFWLLIGLIVLMPILSGCGLTSSQYGNPYQMGKDEPYGIVEFFNITSFGPFLKGLEQGPESYGENRIVMYNPKTREKQIVGITGVPQVGENLAFKNMPLAYNFSLCRIALPPGKYRNFYVAAIPSESSISIAGTTYYYYLFPLNKVITVYNNRISLVRIHADIKNGKIIYQTFQPQQTLPIPPNPKKVSADPKSINDLFELLKEEDWGFRWYAAKRLGVLGDKRSIQPLQQALEKEKHIDVRKVMEDALKELQ